MVEGHRLAVAVWELPWSKGLSFLHQRAQRLRVVKNTAVSMAGRKMALLLALCFLPRLDGLPVFMSPTVDGVCQAIKEPVQ